MARRRPPPEHESDRPDGHRDRGPSPTERCAECGEPLGHEWISYQQDPDDPQNVIQSFAGLVTVGPIGPPDKPRMRNTRTLRLPEELGLFFHSSCAPHMDLPQNAKKGLAGLLAEILVADYRRTLERWARTQKCEMPEVDPPRYHALVARAEGRRVFTMSRAEWEQFKTHEGRLVDLEIDRTPGAGIEEAASLIASLAAERSLHTELIEVWPYSAINDPTPSALHDYRVVDNLTPRRIDVPKFAERAGTRDSSSLRKYLRDHVFIVKQGEDQGRREPKAHAVDRLVFMTVTPRGR